MSKSTFDLNKGLIEAVAPVEFAAGADMAIFTRNQLLGIIQLVGDEAKLLGLDHEAAITHFFQSAERFSLYVQRVA